ncbi:MAG: mecR1 2, partial [Verrucomicrobiales bacterium]|nr:mecR1 2 [Verrucomicrobiales bacterium]
GYSDYEVALSDANGRFELTPKLEPEFVLAAHRKLGFGQLPVSDLLAGAKLKLKPWGYVKGVLKVGDKIEPQYYASLNSANSWSPGPNETRQMIYTYMKVKPQADGSFSFDAVPPGQRTVSLRYQTQDRDYGPTRLSHSVPIEVKSGETNVVVVGGTGRTVTGKLECTGPSGQLVSWNLYSQTLRPSYSSASMLRPRIPPPNATLEERQRINQEYQNAIMESNRRQQMQNNITYCLVCEEDGTFRVPNLPPGEYYLNITAVVPSGTGNSGSYRHIGNISQTVTVPEGTTPYDLGTFVIKSNQ